MTHVVESTGTFVTDVLEGLVQIHADLVRRVEGGVVRRSDGSRKVAVVTGGGSGHYPAFAGYVGVGLADAAVVGELFASPSTRQILGVCEAVPIDAGVVLVFGNYAGDVLNFEAAAESLRSAGTEVACLAVTDDIASAPAEERHRRRGVAGDVPVLKVLGAAAEEGLSFADVLASGRSANDRTRSFGIAFSGATMPGQSVPMFSLPAGSMGLGMGIHGEPGISEQPLASASRIASSLVEAVWAERPAAASDRVAVVLNGLGSTKYEELFGLWSYVYAELVDRGATVVQPLVGEYVTSLDMAGCSLSVLWLDDDLERLWTAAAEAPALRRGGPVSPSAAGPASRRGIVRRATPGRADDVPVSAASQWLAGRIQAGFAAVADTLSLAEAELGRIDAQAGDGDHGQGMARGSAAASSAAGAAVAAGAGARAVMQEAAEAWADRAGGTSGALWGVALEAVAAGLDRQPPTSAAGHARAALAAIQRAGGASVGDKTMVDALVPFVESLEYAEKRGTTLTAAWRPAAAHATDAAEGTKRLVPRLGRARPLAERSLGHPDAGAISLALMATALADLVEKDQA